jgi:hypothetical protein
MRNNHCRASSLAAETPERMHAKTVLTQRREGDPARTGGSEGNGPNPSAIVFERRLEIDREELRASPGGARDDLQYVELCPHQ